MRRSASLVALIFGLIATSLLACSPGPVGDSDGATEETGRFVEALRSAFLVDFDVVDRPRDLVDLVDVVVVGSITDVVAGRTLPYGRDDRQANLVVAVDRTMKGETDSGTLYVEVPLGSLSIEELQALRPAGRVVLFLGDRTHLRGLDGEAGRPPDAPIYAPHAAGFLIEAEGGLLGAYVDLGDLPEPWQRLRSIEDLLAAIE
jgi:hypothetical protein